MLTEIYWTLHKRWRPGFTRTTTRLLAGAGSVPGDCRDCHRSQWGTAAILEWYTLADVMAGVERVRGQAGQAKATRKAVPARC